MGGTLALIVLDETVVGVALPTIRKDLGMSQVNSHWIVNAYFLAITVFAAAAGKMGDLFGYRRLFLTALAVFGLSSIACGFAQNGTWLITARTFQGLGGAVIFPFTFAMITAIFQPQQRGRALGIQTAVGGTFISLGPLVGGFFTDVLSWRWIFWINIPVVLLIGLLIIIAWREPEKSVEEKAAAASRFDVKGLALLVLALCALVTAVMEVPDYHWTNPIILAGIVVGCVALVLFFRLELRTRYPLIEISLFYQRIFSVMNAIVFMGEFGKMALIIFGAIFLQRHLHLSPLTTGVALLPAVIPSLFTSPVTGYLADKYDARKVSICGLSLNAFAMFWLAFAVSFENYIYLIPGFVAWGCALPFHFVSARRAMVNALPPEHVGQGGGLTVTAQLLGGTSSIAVCGTLYALTNDLSVVYVTSGGLMVLLAISGYLIVRRISDNEK